MLQYRGAVAGHWLSPGCSFPQTVIDDARSLLLPRVNSFLPECKNSFLWPWSINQDLRTWFQRETGAKQKFKKPAVFFIFIIGTKFLLEVKEPSLFIKSKNKLLVWLISRQKFVFSWTLNGRCSSLPSTEVTGIRHDIWPRPLLSDIWTGSLSSEYSISFKVQP